MSFLLKIIGIRTKWYSNRTVETKQEFYNKSEHKKRVVKTTKNRWFIKSIFFPVIFLSYFSGYLFMVRLFSEPIRSRRIVDSVSIFFFYFFLLVIECRLIRNTTKYERISPAIQNSQVHQSPINCIKKNYVFKLIKYTTVLAIFQSSCSI